MRTAKFWDALVTYMCNLMGIFIKILNRYFVSKYTPEPIHKLIIEMNYYRYKYATTGTQFVRKNK